VGGLDLPQAGTSMPPVRKTSFMPLARLVSATNPAGGSHAGYGHGLYPVFLRVHPCQSVSSVLSSDSVEDRYTVNVIIHLERVNPRLVR